MEFLIRYSNEMKWINQEKKRGIRRIVEFTRKSRVEGFPFESQIYVISSFMTS